MKNTQLKYYIVDTTVRSAQNQPATFIFNTIPELIQHLEGTCIRYFKQPRIKVMSAAADTGLLEDDRYGRAFYELFTEYFNIGYIINNTPVRKHIFEAEYSYARREEMGD